MKLPTHQEQKNPASMGVQESGRFITRPSVIMLFLICVLLYYVFSSGDYSEAEIDTDELSNDQEETWEHHERMMEKEKRKKEKEQELNNEMVLGNKRYKLYEKKRLNFKKAEAYCKKHDGKLARTEKMDEMQRLQTLLMKARQVSDEMWIGVNKKEWKKHAWKARDHPGGIDPEALGGMNAMMMGGGNQEMCPSLSSSTRALAPAMCLRELPFICEFDTIPKPKSATKPDRKDTRRPKYPKGRDPMMGMGSRGQMGMDRGRPMPKNVKPRAKPKSTRSNQKRREEMK